MKYQVKDPVQLANLLLNWYKDCGRILPWRASQDTRKNPYHIWLSEIMLQQTTVQTVKDYFTKFISKWPSLQDLANAPLDDILEQWSGLGYYHRAKNLHKCAQTICHNYAGHFPKDAQILIQLPGIGPYTSASIASIAFDQRATIVDGNVQRVISRLFAIETPLPHSLKQIYDLADQITPAKAPGAYAEAIMDLGATVCRIKNPLCSQCPFVKHCKAHEQGITNELPMRVKKKQKPTRKALFFWLEFRGHFYVRKRSDQGLLPNLLEIPSTPWDKMREDFDELIYQDQLYSEFLPYEGNWKRESSVLSHVFTHFNFEMHVMSLRLNHKPNFEQGQWIPMTQYQQYAFPTIMKKIIQSFIELK